VSIVCCSPVMSQRQRVLEGLIPYPCSHNRSSGKINENDYTRTVGLFR
jgi:hypothetical protein